MKTLAGANPDAKPDYRTQALTELNKLESKVILLNEILDNVDTSKGEKFVQGDVYDVSFPHCSFEYYLHVSLPLASCLDIARRTTEDPEMDIQR